MEIRRLLQGARQVHEASILISIRRRSVREDQERLRSSPSNLRPEEKDGGLPKLAPFNDKGRKKISKGDDSRGEDIGLSVDAALEDDIEDDLEDDLEDDHPDRSSCTDFQPRFGRRSSFGEEACDAPW
jgi:hypothetical protein